VIPFDAAVAFDVSDGVDQRPLFLSPPVAEGPLRDLLDFGSALGTVVLSANPAVSQQDAMRGSADKFGGPQKAVKSVLDALRVDMQGDYPAPLNFHNGNDMVRIDGILPKNLTARSLKASLAGNERRRLTIRYFLGKDDNVDNVVAVEENFDLDFSPTEKPKIAYRASTGQFELLLKRPVVKPSQQVAIHFDIEQARPKERASTFKKTAANAASTAAGHMAADEDTSSQPADEPQQSAFTENVLKQYMKSDRDFVQALRHSRLADLPKLTQALNHQELQYGTKDTNARAQAAAQKAKRFVSKVRLDKAKRVLKSAFQPLDTGLVMLEIHHSGRSL